MSQTTTHTYGFGPETYLLFGGDESAIGEYSAQIWTPSAETDTAWTLTARVNGEVAWVEEGLYFPVAFSYGSPYDLSDSSDSLTDVFTVTVDSISDSEC